MDGPVLYDAEIIVDGDSIVEVRPCRTPANERRDLGNAVLMPGLVNAHTHLEYTALRGYIEDVPFFSWIRALTAAKSYLTTEDWLLSAKLGALECLSSGTTAIGDNTDAGVTVDAARECGLRGTIYQEYFSIDPVTPVSAVIDELAGKVEALLLRAGGRLRIGVSPHATYTVSPAGFSGLLQDKRIKHLPISIHVAESRAEVDLIESGTGPFAAMFDRREINWVTPRVSATQYVQEQGILGPRTLMVHCVHQDDNDIALAAASRSAIIHCPKSNAKLGAGIAPLGSWLKQPGLRLGIGTDSAVSNNSLDLFEEMRFAVLTQRARTERVETVGASTILELATTRGAEALGLEREIGSLASGKKADFIAVDLEGIHFAPASDPISALVYSATGADVKLTVIGGEVCYDNGTFPGFDISDICLKAAVIRGKLPKLVV